MPIPHRNSKDKVATRRVSDITIGVRHRKDLGDIDGLARWITEVGGLMHPIVVRPDNVLIAGERRLAACKLLGWTEVPVTVFDLAEVARGEMVENIARKDFLPSEIDAIRRTYSWPSARRRRSA